MASQFGVCNNKVGCSLAYTGEKIPVPPGGACPECGQPLATDTAQNKRGNQRLLLILLLLALLAVAAAGTVFLLRDQLVQLAFHSSEPKRKVLELPDSEEKAVVKESASPATSPETLATNAATPAPSAQLADQGTTPPQLADSNTERPSSASTPPPPPPAASPVPAAVSAPTPQLANQIPTPPPAPTPANPSTQTSPPPPAMQQSPATGEDQVQPAPLSKTEVEAARQDVLKRINAMPKLSADEKQRLTEKMETARSMERLFVVRFATGQTSASKTAVDALVQKFKSKEVQDKINDPTVVFVVAGYADTAGDPKKNLQLSEQRAESVSKFLKERTNLLNVVHSVGMGSTDLLDSKRTDPNRAVEIWVVAP
ncbi:MAG TPA: OmpA family protein [Terriglobales bacterium]|nr:OmpA family protein [Terriglobales bacterium]